MTESKYGFFGFINEDESIMTIHSWSGAAMRECEMIDKPQHFTISEAGIWGEAVRNRSPYILNDYAADHPAKKGLPGGHVELNNLLVVPNLVSGQIVTVAAVANREAAYDEADIHQVSSFLTSVQSIVNRRLAEEQLRESEERFRAALPWQPECNGDQHAG